MNPAVFAKVGRWGASARRLSGFTLIELLVVISILAILMGFIIPAFFGTKDKGNMARAKVEAKQLETAWKQFFLTYNRWPNSVNNDDAKVYRMEDFAGGDKLVAELCGLSGADVNIRRITFFDAGLDLAQTNATYSINDPWKQPYFVRFDYDFNNQITLPAGVGGGIISRSVVVWTSFISSDNKTNIVKSWD